MLHSEKIENNNLSSNRADGPLPDDSAETGKTTHATSTELSVSTHVKESAVATSCELSQVLLSTVLIEIKNNNKIVKCRALLDSGSQSNFISEALCQELDLKCGKIRHAVKGIGETLSNINKKANVEIKSRNNNFKQSINCLVLNKITDKLPCYTFSKNR